MFLSRRTVQTYISRILTKLDAKSRVEIVREAVRQGVPLTASSPSRRPPGPIGLTVPALSQTL